MVDTQVLLGHPSQLNNNLHLHYLNKHFTTMKLLRTLFGHLRVSNLHLHPFFLPNLTLPTRTRTSQSLAPRTILYLVKLLKALKFLKVLKPLKPLKVHQFYHINLFTLDLQLFKLIKFLKFLKCNKEINLSNYQQLWDKCPMFQLQLPLRMLNWSHPIQLHLQHKVYNLLLPTLRTWTYKPWTYKPWNNVWVQLWKKAWKKVWNLWQLH